MVPLLFPLNFELQCCDRLWCTWLFLHNIVWVIRDSDSCMRVIDCSSWKWVCLLFSKIMIPQLYMNAMDFQAKHTIVSFFCHWDMIETDWERLGWNMISATSPILGLIVSFVNHNFLRWVQYGTRLGLERHKWIWTIMSLSDYSTPTIHHGRSRSMLENPTPHE